MNQPQDSFSLATGHAEPHAAGRASAADVAVMTVLCIAYAINAADRQLFPTLLPSIRQTYGWDLKSAGLLSTSFTLGLALSGVPAGYLADRVSRKVTIIAAMGVYSAFTLATVYARGFWDMLGYRAATGVGEGIQMTALFAVVGTCFAHRRSLFIGWLIVAYGAGAFVGPRLGALIHLTTGSWRLPFIWFAAIGVVIAGAVRALVPDSYSERTGVDRPDHAAPDVGHVPLGLWHRNVLAALIACLVLGFSLYGFQSLYTVFLKEALHFAPATAAAAFSFFGLGGLLSAVGGWCGDRYAQPRVVAAAFAALSVVAYAMYNVAGSPTVQSLLALSTGVCASAFAFVNLLALLQRSVRPSMVGRASGLFLASVFGAGSVAGYLFGALVSAFGWATAATLELTLLPWIGILAMTVVDPARLLPLARQPPG